MSNDISPREAFKLGFLQRCADDGLDAAATQERIEKTASLLKSGVSLTDIKQLGSNVWNLAGDPAGGISKGQVGLLGAGTLAAGAVPMFGGWAIGRLLSRLKGEHLDPEDVKKQEIINQYKALTNGASSANR